MINLEIKRKNELFQCRSSCYALNLYDISDWMHCYFAEDVWVGEVAISSL